MDIKSKDFSIDISHELKTRLTVIRGEIELALKRMRTREEYKNTLESLREEVEALQAIIENLLVLKRSGSKKKSHHKPLK
jgi:signal transduction histidine kinase